MDHPCEKCEYSVEDGIAFCPRCRAPQIRVVLPEIDPSGLLSPAAGSVSVSAGPATLRWSLALPVCAVAGILAGFVMALTGPTVLWPLVAGFASVVFYCRRNPALAPSARIGARLGAASAVFAIAVFCVTASYNGMLRDTLAMEVGNYVTLKAEPRFHALALWYLESLQQPGALGAWLFAVCLRIVTFSAIGGALAGSFLRRRKSK